MNILALDLGRKLGWAFRRDNGWMASGVEILAKEGAGLFVTTGAFTTWLWEHLQAWKPDMVVYEQPIKQFGKGKRIRGSKAMELALGMAGITAGVSQEVGAKVQSYNVRTIKARVAGHGLASKDAVKRAVAYYWKDHVEELLAGREPESLQSDRSDALAVLLCALWEHDPAWRPAVELKL